MGAVKNASFLQPACYYLTFCKCELNKSDIFDQFLPSLIAACAERYSGRTFWTTAPYPSNHLAYDPNDYFPPFLTLHIKFEEAEAYRKATGCYLRKNQWEDLTVDVYL